MGIIPKGCKSAIVFVVFAGMSLFLTGCPSHQTPDDKTQKTQELPKDNKTTTADLDAEQFYKELLEDKEKTFAGMEGKKYRFKVKVLNTMALLEGIEETTPLVEAHFLSPSKWPLYLLFPSKEALAKENLKAEEDMQVEATLYLGPGGKGTPVFKVERVEKIAPAS